MKYEWRSLDRNNRLAIIVGCAVAIVGGLLLNLS